MPANAFFAQVRSAMGRDLTTALKTRERIRVAALRRALNALDNATAAPATAETLPTRETGPEVARRTLTRSSMEAVLLREARECTEAANEYHRLGHGDRAQRLRAEAGIIRGCLKYLEHAAVEGGS